MSFVAPLWLALAAVVGAGVVVAHLFSTDVPPRDMLPTVQFVPEGAPMAVLRTHRLTDLLLLLLRLLAVTLLGLALAGAHVRRDGPRRVVLADMSRAVASAREVRDSVRNLADGSVIVAFDTAAGPMSRDSVDRRITASQLSGSLSAGLAAAHRALSPDRRRGAELVILSPVVREEVDSATARLIALWDGPIRVARVPAAAPPAPASWEVRAEGDDPVAAALAGAPVPAAGRPTARLVRMAPAPADSIWARDTGGALVLWPADSAAGMLAPRAAVDSQYGVAAARLVMVGEFARRFQPRPGRVIARWMDGEPAATERPLGTGCIRDVAIPVDPVGDGALRESLRGLARSLAEPCGGARDFRAADLPGLLPPSERRAANAERGGPNALAVPQVAARESLWFAILALVALLCEQLLRGRRRTAAAA